MFDRVLNTPVLDQKNFLIFFKYEGVISKFRF